MATVTPQLDSSAIEPQTLEIVRGLLAELGSHRAPQIVTPESLLERELGLGSLERVELLVRVESRFGLRLPDEVAQRAETPADWVRAILEVNADLAQPAASAGAAVRYRIQQPGRDAPTAPETARNWVDVLRRHAEFEPERVHVHLLEEDSGLDITYGGLLEAASKVAAALVASGLRRDETVAIMLPTCADFFYAFYGVMLAGGIAVPIYPPARPDKIEEYVRRQIAILRNAEVRFLITFGRAKAVSDLMRLSLPSLVRVTTVDHLRSADARLPAAGIEPSDTAFIQYTSGSTGDPKGVVLSQANVLANVKGIGWAVKFRPTDIVVSWLPLYHDMGLIGSWLFSAYFGAPITVLSPLAFLSRPERWLWALHESRGTLCPAPNFSYELCARKIPDAALAGLDLSAWRVAIDAGEAVLPETLERFEERFRPYGFRPESFVPCYGLAESSVALSFPPIDRRPVIDVIRRDVFEAEGNALPAGARDSRRLRFVSNGFPLPGHEVRILDEQGNIVAERVQGRLFFRGPSKTAGYFRNPNATAAVVNEGGWMDSGDLAYLAGGEIYITGRLKDCIIKSGRNIIPQEVEAAAADASGVRRGCVAAFGSPDPQTGTERLVVVAETRTTSTQELQRMEAEVLKKIDAALGIPPDKVVFVPPQSIPKTSSGKIRRNATRSLYENGELRPAKRPPWLQFARLWLGNLDSWLRSGLERLVAGIRRAYTSASFFVTARGAGLLLRLAPMKKAWIARTAARWLLRLNGVGVALQGGELMAGERAAVLVANRSGRLDPLLLAAALPSPFLISDVSVLAGLPPEAAFLLRPLVLPALNGESTPPGGTLKQRIRRGLEEGHSVLVFPDGPAGAPAHLSRFRLDAIDATVATGSRIVPIGLRGTGRILRPKRNLSNGEASEEVTPKICVGKPLDPCSTDRRELVAIRERVREAIAKLCR